MMSTSRNDTSKPNKPITFTNLTDIVTFTLSCHEGGHHKFAIHKQLLENNPTYARKLQADFTQIHSFHLDRPYDDAAVFDNLVQFVYGIPNDEVSVEQYLLAKYLETDSYAERCLDLYTKSLQEGDPAFTAQQIARILDETANDDPMRSLMLDQIAKGLVDGQEPQFSVEHDQDPNVWKELCLRIADLATGSNSDANKPRSSATPRVLFGRSVLRPAFPANRQYAKHKLAFGDRPDFGSREPLSKPMLNAYQNEGTRALENTGAKSGGLFANSSRVSPFSHLGNEVATSCSIFRDPACRKPANNDRGVLSNDSFAFDKRWKNDLGWHSRPHFTDSTTANHVLNFSPNVKPTHQGPFGSSGITKPADGVLGGTFSTGSGLGWDRIKSCNTGLFGSDAADTGATSSANDSRAITGGSVLKNQCSGFGTPDNTGIDGLFGSRKLPFGGNNNITTDPFGGGISASHGGGLFGSKWISSRSDTTAGLFKDSTKPRAGNLFGRPSSLFGQPQKDDPQTASSLFGNLAPTKSLYESAQSGTDQTPRFGGFDTKGNGKPPTTSTSFQPTLERDLYGGHNHYQHLSFQSQYQNFSTEELRLADYKANLTKDASDNSVVQPQETGPLNPNDFSASDWHDPSVSSLQDKLNTFRQSTDEKLQKILDVLMTIKMAQDKETEGATILTPGSSADSSPQSGQQPKKFSSALDEIGETKRILQNMFEEM